MAQQVRRQMNYVDGTAARQMYAAPARRVHEPERKAPSRRVAPTTASAGTTKGTAQSDCADQKDAGILRRIYAVYGIYGMSGCWIKRIDVISEYEDQYTAEQHQCLRGRT